MKNVQQEIDIYRSETKNKFKSVDCSEVKSKEESMFRKTLNTHDENGIKKEIRLLENKLTVTRKKIDEQIEKNTNVRKEIDVVRK